MPRSDIPPQKLKKILYEWERILRDLRVQPSAFNMKRKYSTFDRDEMLAHTSWILVEARRALEKNKPRTACAFMGMAGANLSTCALIPIGEAYDLITA